MTLNGRDYSGVAAVPHDPAQVRERALGKSLVAPQGIAQILPGRWVMRGGRGAVAAV